ncbi:MAG: ribonuclease D, partial [Candidatus Sericytochromatia bacterium]|nr:ribonuclease D [Candidatus Sericytochromatia bacterium]
MKFELQKGDLSDEVTEIYLNSKFISVDTETLGLNNLRDKLCLVQLCNEDEKVILLQISSKDTPNLKKTLESENSTKLFHYARFDLAILKHDLAINVKNPYCTKIVSKLVRTYTDKHGLKNLVSELLGIDLDKSSQTTDWSEPELSKKQLEYAANDVLFLVRLREKLELKLKRENRSHLAEECFKF